MTKDAASSAVQVGSACSRAEMVAVHRNHRQQSGEDLSVPARCQASAETVPDFCRSGAEPVTKLEKEVSILDSALKLAEC